LTEPEADHAPSFDVLQWWRAHSGVYSRLPLMARDYLAVPSTSTPAERAFSRGAGLVYPERGSLSAETIRASMCLQSWMHHLPCFGKLWLQRIGSGL
jgi:hAT family C-terminal dimerisation region